MQAGFLWLCELVKGHPPYTPLWGKDHVTWKRQCRERKIQEISLLAVFWKHWRLGTGVTKAVLNEAMSTLDRKLGQPSLSHTCRASHPHSNIPQASCILRRANHTGMWKISNDNAVCFSFNKHMGNLRRRIETESAAEKVQALDWKKLLWVGKYISLALCSCQCLIIPEAAHMSNIGTFWCWFKGSFKYSNKPPCLKTTHAKSTRSRTALDRERIYWHIICPLAALHI